VQQARGGHDRGNGQRRDQKQRADIENVRHDSKNQAATARPETRTPFNGTSIDFRGRNTDRILILQ
jgi:hypothetical protein